MREAGLFTLTQIVTDKRVSNDMLEHQTNDIVSTFIHGMRPGETFVSVREAAIVGLCSTLAKVPQWFESKTDIRCFVNAVFSCGESANTDMQALALQCLTHALSSYKDQITPFITKKLMLQAEDAIKSGEVVLAISAILFLQAMDWLEYDEQFAEELAKMNHQTSFDEFKRVMPPCLSDYLGLGN